MLFEVYFLKLKLPIMKNNKKVPVNNLVGEFVIITKGEFVNKSGMVFQNVGELITVAIGTSGNFVTFVAGEYELMEVVEF